MPPLSLLIKPASGNCNMRCRYCFYFDEVKTREQTGMGMMSEETAQAIIQQAVRYAQGSPITFAFQGGEPTLRGLSFFEFFIQTVQIHNIRNSPITYTLQTNGLLLDERWADFLFQHHFLVGLSLDGPAGAHDALRVDAAGKGTYPHVMQAVSLLKRRGIEFNILCVVNGINGRNPERLYRFYREREINYLQFIPLILTFENSEARPEYFLTPKRYGAFLSRTFDLYYQDILAGKQVSIRFFDNILLRLMGCIPESCDMGGTCSLQNVIEYNGDVYPCDFYAVDSCRMGNIVSKTFSELYKAEAAEKFIHSVVCPKACTTCRWAKICPGRCRRYAEPSGTNSGISFYCEAFQSFFSYTIQRFLHLSQSVGKV